MKQLSALDNAINQIKWEKAVCTTKSAKEILLFCKNSLYFKYNTEKLGLSA
jgi:hypothetical protein